MATIYNEADSFSTQSNRAITEELGRYSDVTIAHATSYNLSQGGDVVDVSAQIEEIKNAMPEPEAIFLSSLPVGQLNVMPAAYRSGLRIPFIANLISIDNIKAINEKEPGAGDRTITFQVWLVDSPVQESQDFVSLYTRVNGSEPGDWAARGYAAAKILGEALRKATSYDASSIRDALASVKDYRTIYGTFSFDDDGDAIYDPIIAEAQNDTFKVLVEE